MRLRRVGAFFPGIEGAEPPGDGEESRAWEREGAAGAKTRRAAPLTRAPTVTECRGLLHNM